MKIYPYFEVGFRLYPVILYGLRLTGNRAETENVEINPTDSVIDQK